MKVRRLNILFIIFLSVIVIYIFDFYLLDNNANENFWCVEIIENYRFGSIENIKFPIHCDEGTYRLASSSLEDFFDRSNPYQSRPLFVGFIAFVKLLVNNLSIIEFSDYQQFKVSIFLVQLFILYFIVRLFIHIAKFHKLGIKETVLIFIVCSIPSVRWNLFFPSVGNLTFLFFLISINFLTNIKKNKKNENIIFMLLGFLSLAHMSAIIYGLAIKLYKFIKDKKIKTQQIFQLILLFAPYILYRLVISISKFEYYDWHKNVYKQFYWIIESFQKKSLNPKESGCQTFQSFFECNNLVTFNFLGYFLILLIFFIVLISINKSKYKNSLEILKPSLFICFFIFIFWTFQGYYESFRFVNYSIGYFLFTSVIFMTIFLFKNNIFLVISLLLYFYSVSYLEPYNDVYRYPNINYLTIFSILFFLIFVFSQFKFKNFENSKLTR